MLVEGKYDKLLIEKVLAKCFQNTKFNVQPYQSANKNTIKTIVGLLHETKRHYIMLVDQDHKKLQTRINDRVKFYGVQRNRVVNVTTVIESWYAAGCPKKVFDFGKERTDQVDKKSFYKMILPKNSSTIGTFLSDVANNFDSNMAMQRNSSFKNFYQRMKNLVTLIENQKNKMIKDDA